MTTPEWWRHHGDDVTKVMTSPEDDTRVVTSFQLWRHQNNASSKGWHHFGDPWPEWSRHLRDDFTQQMTSLECWRHASNDVTGVPRRLKGPTHGPNIYKETKPEMSSIRKNWPVKVLCVRCLSAWGPRSPTPPLHTPVLIHTGKGGGGHNQGEG
jgi:hypothetical protein